MKRNGFALPLAIAVMVVVTAIAATAIQVALSDFQANHSLRLAARALYAAEAGAHHTVARWTSGPYAALAPGDSVGTGWVSLPGGSSYQSFVRRVDNGTRPVPLFRVMTEGRPGRNDSARRQIITMVEATLAGKLCCKGAVTVRGDLTVRADDPPKGAPKTWVPPTQVDGRDHVPIAWAGYCPAPEPAVAGVAMTTEKELKLNNGAIIDGTPPSLSDATIGAGMADNLGTTTFAALAAKADIVYTQANPRIRGTIAPSAKGGVCNTDDQMNWGAPDTPKSVCWTYLPIIYAQKNFRIDAEGQGQGILLVEGDLTLNADFKFYGLVVVKGTATIRGTTEITGGLIVANNANGNGSSVIRDEAVVRYASCALSRVSGGPGSAKFLTGRYWFEVS